MDPLLQMLLLTALAGAALPCGGLLAHIESLRPHWLENELRHGIIAFGGGLLISAVALVLVPEGIARTSTGTAVISLLLGGIAFMLLDAFLARHHTPASQLAAALGDFVPEAIALGAAFSAGDSTGPLLALLIGLQNLPEGFNAFREMRSSGLAVGRVLRLFAFAALLGPLCGFAGYTMLGDQPAIVGTLMMFASGGILYLTFQDIAPQGRLERHWGPPLGAVLGFGAGLLGELLIGSGPG